MKQNGGGDASTSKVDMIYKIVKQRIISTEYMPGEFINETDIAKELSVSRTPIREALRCLQQDNWLIAHPKIGMQVINFDLNHLKDLFNTKEALEVLALKLAIDNVRERDILRLRELLDQLGCLEDNDFHTLFRLDDSIHRVIWEIAGNRILDIYLPDLQERLNRAWLYTRRQGVKFDKDQLHRTFVLIVQSILDRDKEAAVAAEHEHMEYHRNEMRMALI